jgi:hypothetical protein
MIPHLPYVPGVPRRWGVALAAMFDSEKPGQYAAKHRLIQEIQSDCEQLPLDAGDDAIFRAADAASRECYRYCGRYQLASLIVDGVFLLCLRMGVARPVGATSNDIIARAVDRAWWVRAIRKAHARRFEHAAIRLGFTGVKTGPYISNESALRQAKRNADNAKLLESTELQNEHGQTYTLAELAALGVANKANRRGELMTRIRGFEEIASDLKHVGMFWTVTCPSKFHAVGGENDRYEGFAPREAQAYLVRVWALIRAKLHRQGIRPYGFRIAEPHTDGCPHWHLLLFVAPEHALRMQRIITLYARYEDPHEKGAKENRVKLIRIEAGKGTAAGYIAKYVAKNIDGAHVGEHKTKDGYTIVPDMFGNEEITPSQRVTYWSQLHGIRQFQQIGGAPVGVWRELRRIKAEAVYRAPEEIKAAWQACQKIESDDPAVAKQADYAAYMRAQGGPMIGRKGMVQLAKRMTTIDGRYGKYEEEKPCGVYHATNQNAVYESVRYQWTPVEPREAVAVPWTGVNKCTEVAREKRGAALKKAVFEQYGPPKNKKICSADWNFVVTWDASRRYDREGRLLERVEVMNDRERRLRVGDFAKDGS